MNVFYEIGVIFGLFIVYMGLTLVIGWLMTVLTDSNRELETWFFWAWVVGFAGFFVLLKMSNLLN